MTIQRITVRKKYLLMPDPQTVTLYRLDRDDKIEKTQSVKYVEKRWPTKKERASKESPEKTKTITFHFWYEPLAGWVLRENDYFQHGADWWHIESVTEELFGERMRVACQRCNPLV